MKRLIKNIVPMARYVAKTIEHKTHVFHMGRRLRVPLWRLIKHDWSKFTPSELPHYARQFYGSKDDPTGWVAAWLHHQNHNPHHWEYWITRSGTPGLRAGDPAEMPETYVREMIADWLAASRSYSGSYPASRDAWPWFQQNFNQRVVLHPNTRLLVQTLLDQHFSGSAS